MLKPVDRLQEACFGDKLVLWVCQISLQTKSMFHIAVHCDRELVPRLGQYFFCLTTLCRREEVVMFCKGEYKL